MIFGKKEKVKIFNFLYLNKSFILINIIKSTFSSNFKNVYNIYNT